MTQRRVVVTGIGTINPLGNNIAEYFTNLEKGVSGAAPITHFDAEKFKTKFACEVKNYDPAQHFDRKEVRKYDLFTQYALIAATQAVEDSALDLEKIDLEQAGVIWSSGIGGLKSFFDECLGYAEGGMTPRFSPFFIPRMIADIAAGFISMKYGFMGPNYCTVSACASSNHGLIDAFNYIRWGKATVMVAGGSEAAVNEPSVGGFNSMQALSTRNDDPQHASRPFDKDRDGFVIGEGAGALILEEYEHAKARGAKIYCEIVGGGCSADAYHFTAPHPEGKGAKKAMRDAIAEAGITPDQIDYVNVHGTSTPRAQGRGRSPRRARLRRQHLVHQVDDRPPAGRRRCDRGPRLHLRHQPRNDSAHDQLREPRPRDRPATQPHAQQGAETRSALRDEQHVRIRRPQLHDHTP